MANYSLHHPLLMALTIIINLCLISTAQSPPAPPSTTIPPSPPSVPSLPTIMAPSPAPSLPTTTIQPPSAVPSLPTTMAPPPPLSLPTITIQPPPPVPSLPTTMAPPPPPSRPTTIIPPPPPLPSLPTTVSPPSPPPTTTSTPPSPPPSTIIPSTSPASSPTTALTSPPNTTSSPPPPPTTTTSPPPPPPPPLEESDPQDEQFDNIIDALLSAGDFGAWAGILSAADLSGFPLVATLFIPGNDALSHFPTATSSTLNFDPYIIPYHIIPQRLTFSDLQQFKSHTRLPTLLPSKTILITDNSPSNFSINDSPITHPDLYATTSVSVHGIKTILDYSLYGGNDLYLPDETMPRPTPPQETAQPFLPTAEILGRRRSDAACLCTEFPIVLSVVCAALAFKIHRNPLTR